jgi:hypothetical protein
MAKIAALLLLLVTPASVHAATLNGVYRWGVGNACSNVSHIVTYEQWLKRPVLLAEDFEATDSWASIEGASWQLPCWSAWVAAKLGRNLVLGVPLLPGPWDKSYGGGVYLAQCAVHAYDSHWTKLAHNLAAAKLKTAYLRLGWEFNGGWDSWRAPPGDEALEASYAACFRSVVAAMRAAEPRANWHFVWNLNAMWWPSGYLDRTYPGDAYVTDIGIDFYDQSWANGSYPYPANCDAACMTAAQNAAWKDMSQWITAVIDYAKLHHKPVAFPEWGLVNRKDGQGGNDDPAFVQHVHELIAVQLNFIYWNVYFDVWAGDGNHLIWGDLTGEGATKFPLSAAMFKLLFGRP